MDKKLTQKIIQSIAMSGPMPVSQYMHLCNSHPQLGYYATGNPVGKDGDFITAPEVSQMFGELIGLWCLQAWQRLKCPDPVQIVELGPGRATMISDVVRAIKPNEQFYNAAQVSLVETSASLESEQRSRLGSRDISIEWFENIEKLPAMPAIFIANEFLDAIPFRQFVKTDESWLELCVGINHDGESDSNALTFVTGPSAIEETLLPSGHKDQPIGAIFEYAPAREAICIQLAQHIKSYGGTALLVDYGHGTSGFGDTFQAVQSHKPVSTLANPGHSDLTSHVDFQAIGNVAAHNGLMVYDIFTQGDFLLKLGLLERAGRLGHGKSASVQQNIQLDVQRLAGDDQMGSLFKAMCLTHPQFPMPIFDED